jgi:hypothetical protein
MEAGLGERVTVTLDLGFADLLPHQLRVCLDCGDMVQEIGYPFELFRCGIFPLRGSDWSYGAEYSH